MTYLKQIRTEKGITQGELAQALGFTSPQYISNNERGLSKLCAKHFKPIARVLTKNKQEQKLIIEGLIKERLKAEEQEMREMVRGRG